MRTLLFTVLVAVAAVGCSKKSEPSGATEQSSVPTVSVDELDKMLASNQCQAIDANGDGTRKKMGIIPGAILLTDSETFNPGELPSDKSKTLVFYCASTSCGASHEAAGKAITAGYKSVKVLPDGIAGWVKSGKKTSQI